MLEEPVPQIQVPEVHPPRFFGLSSVIKLVYIFDTQIKEPSNVLNGAAGVE